MTRIKERAVEMIQRVPDDDMLYVINILQNLEKMTANKDTDREQAMAAFQDILKYRGRLPAGGMRDRGTGRVYCDKKSGRFYKIKGESNSAG